MTSMPTPKTLFGNNSSPNQTNQPISNSPVSRRDAVAVTQSQDSSPMGHLISVLERNGDAIMIEFLYERFLSIFHYTGKKHYFDIDCGMMEPLYASIEYKLLHLVRVNCTAPLYEGNDTEGRPMANWAIDGLIELIQKFYHKMNFRNDNLDGWMQHSPHLQLNNKSIRFAQAEYTRVYSDAAKSAKFEDTGENDISGRRNKKATSVPKRIQEHYAVAEFCLINKLTIETPGRKYNQDEIWKLLGEITTKLDLESNKEKSQQWTKQVMSEEEECALSTITDNIFSNRDSNNSDSSTSMNALNDDGNEESVTVGFDEIGSGGVEEDSKYPFQRGDHPCQRNEISPCEHL